VPCPAIRYGAGTPPSTEGYHVRTSESRQRDGAVSERVMVVDDDDAMREIFQEKLAHSGYEVQTAKSAEDALARVNAFDPAVIITDLRMPGMSGLDLLDRIKDSMEGVDVIVVTGHEDMSTAVSAMKAGAFDYLVKPADLKKVDSLVQRCLREQELERGREGREEEEGDDEEAEAGPLVGKDPRMIEIYKLIGVLARNRATVLVRGETGTGKELIARAIHTNSVHGDEPFIAVNCTALSDTLLESELFGHKKGAFTGAVSSRKGYFELSGSGTIFLDEIGDTSPEFQTKLLRVLQERQYYPVGGEEPKTTEARVIAATHQPIEELVEQGHFREDLYFRLRVVEIQVPPLRDRRGDIPLLANALLSRIREETHQSVRHISEEAMERLKKYDWPGNVRELENALTRAAILARGTAVGTEHLSLGVDAPVGKSAMRAGEPGAIEPLDVVIRGHLTRALRHTGGDRVEAAALLELPAERLDEHLERVGLDPTDLDS